MSTLTSLIDPPSDQLCCLSELNWPESLRVLIIAPHPDDFDAIAVTLRHFQQRNYPIRLLVLSGGSKGVEDNFAGTCDWDHKARLREAEQLESTGLFGLAESQVEFLHLPEAADGELDNNTENQRILTDAISQWPADIWCLPYGDDSNTGHQRTYAMVQYLAQQQPDPVLCLYNKDAKSRSFNHQLYMPFDQSTAEWKATLLRCHASQQARNLNVRGYGFDQRVLGFNQQTAKLLNLSMPYAEVFQLEFFNADN